MKRVPPHPQQLKHLPFFEVLATAPDGSAEARLATAGLLTLRMIDHWVLAGAAIVEPESVSVKSVRRAIMELPPKEPVREALLTVVNTMQMLRQVDLTPVLPRVFAYAQLLERHHGAIALAADAYQSLIRLADAEFDAELVMDGLQRLAYCHRKTGALDDAAAASTSLERLARRRNDRPRTLRAKIGLAQIAMMHGDYAAADSQFMAVSVEAEEHELTRELGMATHNRAVVASRAGNATRAVVLAHQALRHTSDPVERDRVLSDLGAFLINLERYDAAIDALRIVELTATSEEPRLSAQANIVVAAARAGNRRVFDEARAALNVERLPAEHRLNFLIEAGRGLRRFGELAGSDRMLSQAEEAARTLGLAWPLGEIASARHEPVRVAPRPSTRSSSDPLSVIAADLRQMAAAISG